MSRLSDIESLAESIAESYFPHEKVEPLDILPHKNITHSFGNYGNSFDGLLEYRNQRFHIYTNADRLKHIGDTRARFTLGHELGHFFIDEHRRSLINGVAAHPSVVDFQSNNEAEREADNFAAFLLMPKGRFCSEAKRKPTSANAIYGLSKKFGTSLTSTAIRFIKTTEKPVLVMLWTHMGRQWGWASKSFETLARSKCVSNVIELPEGCLTEEALTVKHFNSNQPRATTVNSWFPYVGMNSKSNELLVEEVFPLGKFGVLTLLYPEERSGPKSYW